MRSARAPGRRANDELFVDLQQSEGQSLVAAGLLSPSDREAIARALGADADMAEETDPVEVGGDPDYINGGGGNSLIYRIGLSALNGKNKPAAVRATLYYQPTPPFFLQDRFCTGKGADTTRLQQISGNLQLDYTPAANWKVFVVTSGTVAVR